MKLKVLAPIILLTVIFVSCKKEGCTDATALNYSAEATKDDGSCQTAKYVRIKSVELKVLQSTDEDGIEWDSLGLPDCFIRVSTFGAGTIYETEVVNDVSTEDITVYTIEPNIVIPIDSLGEYEHLRFTVYDQDGSGNSKMAGAGLVLNNNPTYGDPLWGSDFHKRIKLWNFSINGNNNSHVSMIVVLEWE